MQKQEVSFSVLMAVYSGDKEDHVSEALRSISIESTIQPNQIVLVVDGPVCNSLETLIKSYHDVDAIFLPENVGLSNALNIGLEYCDNDLVFRMDADDVSMPDRFEKQIKFMAENPDISICSAWVAHYDERMEKLIGDRKLPFSDIDNKKYSKMRTPINHPATVFRKSALLKFGGYPNTRLPFEDWWLCLRALNYGFSIYNIQEYLVRVRASKDFHSRRSGIAYLALEYSALSQMRKEGLLSFFWVSVNFIIRTPFRILPGNALDYMYKKVIRKYF